MHNEGFLSVEYAPLRPTLLNGKTKQEGTIYFGEKNC